MVLIDSVSRFVEGVLADGSSQEESFTDGLLEYPQYTRPEIFKDKKVPEVLTSGNHANINKWRRKESLRNTYLKRPDLLEKIDLSNEDEAILKNLENECQQKD